MEASAAARGVSLSIPPHPSQSPRKERRPVSEHPSRSLGNEGRESADANFCSFNIEEDNNNLQQQLYAVARQREDLERLQIELHARIVARSGLMEMHKNFEDRLKEQANTYAKLEEQLHQKEQAAHELEKIIEDKDRELHVVKLDNEAAWAKESLLREQNKELQTYRREHDNSEAEKSQHLKQIHDLQEHIQDRERQLLELQEQNRISQEAIMYKDEQLREAQAWITRAQEMDALHTTTNHNLQAEYNQLWLACQRQFGEMERVHLHTVQQLQLELADARERIGSGADESRVSRTKSNDTSHFVQNGNQLEANGSVKLTGNTGALPNGNVENLASSDLTGNASSQAENAHGVAIASPKLLGIPSPLPPTQVAALHQFVMHQQGVPIFQHWQNQQALPEGSQLPIISPHPSSQNSAYEVPVNGEIPLKQELESKNTNPPSAEVDKTDLVRPPSQESIHHLSSQFHNAIKLDALPQKSEAEGKTIASISNWESQGSISEEKCSVDLSSVTTVPRASSSETFVSSEQKNMINIGNYLGTNLLDERSLLACIVRTIPPGSGGRIRISSTLPNRLDKILAPLHWHDYKKKYGKLDDFLAGHSELFLIEGDYIQLREGAQEIIAAKAALAKVAASAKTASSTYSSTLPSVTVTPMAQSYGLKRNPSVDSNNSHNSMQSQLANDYTNIKILSKSKDAKELNNNFSGNGSSQGSSGANSMGKQQDRRAGVPSKSRR